MDHVDARHQIEFTVVLRVDLCIAACTALAGAGVALIAVAAVVAGRSPGNAEDPSVGRHHRVLQLRQLHERINGGPRLGVRIGGMPLQTHALVFIFGQE